MHSTVKYLLTLSPVVVIVNEHNVEQLSVLDRAQHREVFTDSFHSPGHYQ